MKHPHPGRIAEVYRKTNTGLKYIGYTAGPFHDDFPKEAKWNDEIQGWVLPARQRPILEE